MMRCFHASPRHCAALFAIAMTLPGVGAAGVPSPSEDFMNLELEQLMAMEVTGVTRRAALYARSPAAVFVLTGEDLRRSGARTLAEALRLVPGLHIARTNAQSYTVTSRGFGGDKLQVLLDGRSVYTPLTSTVFWDVFNTYLEDVARIEVIRGPGATVWGANAVNGVINIVTRPAADSVGTHIGLGGGNEELAFGGIRSGAAIGESAHGRVYARARERDASVRADGTEVPDGQKQVQAGGRIDVELDSLGMLSVRGDVYDGRLYSATFPAGTTTDTEVSGVNLGALWTLPSDAGSTEFHLYYDGYDRFIPTIYRESRDTVDLSAVHIAAPVNRHILTVGAGARISSDETGRDDVVVVFDPSHRTTTTYSAFVQDEWDYADNWSLIVGSKFEHNDYTGFEIQPGVRLGWAPTAGIFTWASLARAVRTPNRFDRDIGVACQGIDDPVAGCPGADQVLGVGNDDFESETLLAGEWGLRAQWTPSLLADVALFYNDYDELRSTETGTRFANRIQATGYGGELSMSWEALASLGVQATYSWLEVDARRDDESNDTTTVATLEGTPQQQASLRAAWQPLLSWQIDGVVRYVDAYRAHQVPAYTEVDLRAAWAVTPFVEVALVGRNLLDRAHPEAGAAPATRSEIERSLYGQVTWRWR